MSTHYTSKSTLILMIALLMLAVASYKLWQVTQQQGVNFSHKQQDLNDALDLPWTDFSPVTESEMKIIRSLELDQPLFLKGLHYWREIPDEGLYRFLYDDAETRHVREQLQSAIDEMAILEKLEQDDATIQTHFEKASNALLSVTRHEPDAWIPRYNLGILHLWMNKNVPAIEHLEKAQEITEKTSKPENYPKDVQDRMRAFEAGAVTHYALAIAKFSDQGTRPRAISHFRWALKHVKKIVSEKQLPHTAYGKTASSPASFFRLEYTYTQTYALWNDLIAAYLSCPDFHNLDLAPTKEPNCAKLKTQDVVENSLDYRNKSFCRNLEIAQPPFDKATASLYNGYYNEGKYEDEHLIWALSNIVEVNAYAFDLSPYPHLLYNSALLHTKTGHFTVAAKNISDAYHSPVRTSLSQDRGAIFRLNNPIADKDPEEQIKRLRIVINVLVGRRLESDSCPASEPDPSRLRLAFLELSEGTEEMEPTFPAVGACFEDQNQEREVDQWLFIHYWRAFLEAGDYQGFSRAFDGLKQQKVFTGFFEVWRDEIFRAIGERAFRQYQSRADRNETQQAKLIRRFILSSGYFDAQTRRLFKPTPLDNLSRDLPRILAGLLLLASLIILVFMYSFWSGLRRTFTSYHRKARQKKRLGP